MSLGELHMADWLLLGLLLLSFLVQVYFYARYMASPARQMRRRSKKVKEEASDLPAPLPPVSIIICARNEQENLSNYLHALLSQDYPEYEVIVVDDGSEDDTRAVLDSFMRHDARLRSTFVPYDARVRSTKKLALTLGAKAAKYDYLLLTDADCTPESPKWIQEMVKGFSPSPSCSKDIVLGFGAYFYRPGYVNKLVRFDTLFNGLHFLGAALCGHPYMGVGRNLAYRKDLFFQSGGFTHLMTNVAGDDDLFVNHVATGGNTAVVLSRDSFTWSPAKETMKEWWQQKRRHLSVSPAYRTDTKVRLTIEPFTRGLFYLTFVIIMCRLLTPLSAMTWEAVVAPSFYIPLSIALGLFLVRWILQTAIINVSARRMGLHRFGPFAILWFDILLPLISLWLLLIPKRKTVW